MKRFYMFGLFGMALFLSSTIASVSVADQGDPVAGKATYNKVCAMCHGKTGKGDGPTAAVLNPKPRNHTDGNYMNTLNDDYLFKIVKTGGQSVGKSQLMPGWAAQVKDPDIWNVIAYIRTLAVPPYKAESAAAAPPVETTAPTAAKAAVAPAAAKGK
jgi:mono/diheme cytochrome c family protein